MSDLTPRKKVVGHNNIHTFARCQIALTVFIDGRRKHKYVAHRQFKSQIQILSVYFEAPALWNSVTNIPGDQIIMPSSKSNLVYVSFQKNPNMNTNTKNNVGIAPSNAIPVFIATDGSPLVTATK